MSRQSNNIELKHMRGEFADEIIVSRGHQCAVCHGEGWHWTQDKNGGYKKTPCATCKSTGMMKAVVNIKWVAEDE